LERTFSTPSFFVSRPYSLRAVLPIDDRSLLPQPLLFLFPGHTHGGQFFPLMIGAYFLNPIFVCFQAIRIEGSYSHWWSERTFSTPSLFVSRPYAWRTVLPIDDRSVLSQPLLRGSVPVRSAQPRIRLPRNTVLGHPHQAGFHHGNHSHHNKNSSLVIYGTGECLILTLNDLHLIIILRHQISLCLFKAICTKFFFHVDIPCAVLRCSWALLSFKLNLLF